MELTIETGQCQCGCGAPARSKFLQGHDARLKSALIRAKHAGDEVTVRTGGSATSHDPVKYASRYGFGHVVASATPKVRKPSGRKALAVEVRAKVGRWERVGTVDGDSFTYTDAKGAVQTTTKFALVG